VIEFKGWIPNVAGRLSFKNIGNTNYPRKCLNLNEEDDEGRYLLCLQQRTLKDSPVARWYFQLVTGKQPDWYFVFLAESKAIDADRVASLEGHVFAFLREQWFGQIHGQEHIDIEKTPHMVVRNLLASLHNEATVKQVERSLFRDEVGPLALELQKMCAVSAKCVIGRDGVVTLNPNQISANVLTKPLDESQKAPIKIEGKELQYYMNQLYFFIKDISHRHRHHPDRSDNIINLRGIDEFDSWARECHYSIHRKVVELRRSRDPMLLYNALGMIAYIKSFGKIIKNGGFAAEAETIYDGYQYDSIENSLKAEIEALKWKRTQTNILVVALPALLIALFNMIKNGSPQPKADSMTSAILNILEQSFGGTWLGSLLSILLLCLIASASYGVWSISQLSAFADAKRLLRGFKPSFQFYFYLFLAFSFAICAIAMVYFPSYIAKYLFSIVGETDMVTLGMVFLYLSFAVIFLIAVIFPYFVLFFSNSNSMLKRMREFISGFKWPSKAT